MSVSLSVCDLTSEPKPPVKSSTKFIQKALNKRYWEVSVFSRTDTEYKLFKVLFRYF